MQRVGRPFTNCCPLVFPSRTNAFLHTSLLVGSHSPSLFQVTKTGGLLPPCPLLTVHSLAKLALPQRRSRRSSCFLAQMQSPHCQALGMASRPSSWPLVLFHSFHFHNYAFYGTSSFYPPGSPQRLYPYPCFSYFSLLSIGLKPTMLSSSFHEQ